MKKLVSILIAATLLFCLMPLRFSGAVTDDKDHVVIASFYPVFIFAENILSGVDGITLKCLSAPSTGCLHDYQLLAGDMENLSHADAFLICGAGMEGYLDKALEQFPDLYIIDSSADIELLAEEHEHHHHDDSHDEEDHDDEANAHMWLDPLRAIQMVGNIADGLVIRFPEHAEQIRENTGFYIEKLTLLDAEIDAGLSSLINRDIVTFHEAFPYFADRYGFNIVAVMALEPEEPLSPAAMIELSDEVMSHGCPPLFTEPQYSSKAAEVISRETGSPVFELDPIVTGDYAPDAYEKGMRKNMLTLIEALGECK